MRNDFDFIGTGTNNYDPYTLFTEDQQGPIAPKVDDAFVIYEGERLYTGAIWPCGIPDNASEEWLVTAYEVTGALGAGAMLYAYHGHFRRLDCIPLFLSNPAYMNEHGERTRKAIRKVDFRGRTDVIGVYIRAVEQYPIMMETMQWLSSASQNGFAIRLFKAGLPTAFPYIHPDNVTVELIYEAINNAKNPHRMQRYRASVNQVIEMYRILVQHNGAALLTLSDLVSIAVSDWELCDSAIKSKELSFNDTLSVIMTYITKQPHSTQANNYRLIEQLFNRHGPSDQWPALSNVVAYVNTVTAGRVALPQQQSPHTALKLSRHESQVSKFV